MAMANSEGSEVMLNRVMTKDNIGVAVLLEVNKDMFSGGKNRQSLSKPSAEQITKTYDLMLLCLTILPTRPQTEYIFN